MTSVVFAARVAHDLVHMNFSSLVNPGTNLPILETQLSPDCPNSALSPLTIETNLTTNRSAESSLKDAFLFGDDVKEDTDEAEMDAGI